MRERIKVEYGGADGSCKHIAFTGTDITVNDLLVMLHEAKKKDIYKICIGTWQFDSLIKSIEELKRSAA
jgi:hypothetical protein